ncbi:MAG: MATE family efflux transporter [Paramuribaculum sp.]|nr:MATE family efflux transporter [Paramuribaculum sp.]
MGLTAKILRLGTPILIGQIGTIAVGFADTAMVGHYHTDALASASFVNNFFNLVILSAMGFSFGITPLVGALYPQNKLSGIGSLMRSALAANVMFGLLVIVLMTIAYCCIGYMNQPPELLPLIRSYFLIYLLGIIPVVIFNAFSQWAYAIGRTGMPMWIILSGNIVNILGNYLLIEGHLGCPELGLNGAGIATLIARSLCAIAIAGIFFLKKEYRVYRHGFTDAYVNRKSLGLVWRTSLPVAVQMAFEAGAFSFAGVVAGWFGTVELAAYQVIVILGTLGFCTYYCMGSATSIVVANANGLNDCAMMRRGAFAGFKVLLCMATLSSLLFIFAGQYLLMLFTSDQRVTAMALSVLVPLVLYQYADATQINFAGALRGSSHVMPMLWIAIVSYGIIGVPATYLMAVTFNGGIYGIVLSFSVSLLCAASLFLYTFMKVTRINSNVS